MAANLLDWNLFSSEDEKRIGLTANVALITIGANVERKTVVRIGFCQHYCPIIVSGEKEATGKVFVRYERIAVNWLEKFYAKVMWDILDFVHAAEYDMPSRVGCVILLCMSATLVLIVAGMMLVKVIGG